MRKAKLTLLAAITGWLAGAGAVMAADLPPPIVAPPPAEAPCCASGWYLRGDVGMEVDKQADVFQGEVSSAPGGRFIDHSMNNSAFVGAGVGYRFNGYLRADVTAEFRGSQGISAIDEYKFDCDAAGLTGYGSCGNGGVIRRNNIWTANLTSQVFLANAYFDLCNCGNLTPFVGAGIGFAHHRIHGLSEFDGSDLGGSGYAPEGTNTSFAWAVQAGLGYQVNPNLTLEVAYRYLNMGDAKSGRLDCLPTGCNDGQPFELKNITSQEVKLGMRWQFTGLGGGSCRESVFASCD